MSYVQQQHKVSHKCSLKSSGSHIKKWKEMSETNFNNIFYLTHYMQNLFKHAVNIKTRLVTDERNQRGHKQMEKHTVFMDWKNRYCQNGYTTQRNL